MPEETHHFQAEVSRLLDIVANALYSNKEIFLRELISNASDACDRLRYLALTNADLVGDDREFAVTLQPNAKAKTLTISDNGIGMTHDELISNLGTIARSGTAAFMSELENKKDGAGLIGQFGVGFYSAFMVADKVEVETRKAGEAEGWRWVSDGQGSFAITACESAPTRGTRITLHLKKAEKEYLEASRLRHIVTTYSDHIAIPIKLQEEDGEDASALNTASALWTRSKSDISEEQYKEFYHHVGQSFDEPWLRLHFKVEGKIEYTGLLFIPSSQPFDLFHPDRKNRVKLYVRRVYITDDCPELLPSYLRFLRGVVDSEDMPLNISRELLQHNPMLEKIRKALIKRVLNELKKKAEKAPEDYASFWSNFGAVLKEGVYEDHDQRDALLPLMRFKSTHSGDGWISLADYVARMKEGQEAIYTITGDNKEALARSPQLEGFAAKDVEVLYFTDPVDDFWTSMVPTFEDKPFKSVTKAGTDLDKIAAEKDEDDKADDKDDSKAEGIDAVIAFVKLALKEEVKDVRASERLTTSACCLVADSGDMDIHLERILKQHNQLDQASARVLEINPKHALVKGLSQAIDKQGAGEALEEVAHLLLDQARILEGEALPDPTAFAARLAKVMEKALPT